MSATAQSLPSTIEATVDSTSPFRAIDVRLQVEGVDGANQRTGERLVWASNGIAPGGRTSYFARIIPGAVHYRVTVVSFELVSEDGVSANDDAGGHERAGDARAVTAGAS